MRQTHRKDVFLSNKPRELGLKSALVAEMPYVLCDVRFYTLSAMWHARA